MSNPNLFPWHPDHPHATVIGLGGAAGANTKPRITQPKPRRTQTEQYPISGSPQLYPTTKIAQLAQQGTAKVQQIVANKRKLPPKVPRAGS